MPKLTNKQIEQLEQQGCSSPDWSLVTVDEDFNPLTYHHVIVRGKTHLGTCREIHHSPHLGTRPSGVSYVTLDDCFLGREVLIEHISDCIQGYCIRDRATIVDVFQLKVSSQATFGVGTSISVLDETGGRSVWMSRYLSAHIAYIMAYSKHDDALQGAFARAIEREQKEVQNLKPYIGAETEILHCGSLIDILVGEHCSIIGAVRLHNGCIDDRAIVTGGSTADTFMIGADTMLDSALITHSFIGEGCRLTEGLAVEASLVFANSILAKGEITASLLGPMSVSMHRNTLLIGVQCSLFNAGSGTNQSNHHYRLGPMHYGIMERGTKTGSDCYLFLPAHIGIYSKVSGRVTTHPDLSSFPFSNIIGRDDKTTLIPAITIGRVSLWRDVVKYPQKENRTPATITLWHDEVVCSLQHPFFIATLFKAWKLLTEHTHTEIETRYGVVLSEKNYQRGVDLYRHLINILLALSLKEQMTNAPLLQKEEVAFFDLLGLPIAKKAYRDWSISTAIGESTIAQMNTSLKEYAYKEEIALTAALQRSIITEFYATKKLENIEPLRKKALIEGLQSLKILEQMVQQDAEREFVPTDSSLIGFGCLALSEEEVAADFRQVRCSARNESTLKEIRALFETFRVTIEGYIKDL